MHCLDIKRIVSKDNDLLERKKFLKKKNFKENFQLSYACPYFLYQQSFPKLKQENNSK